MSRPRVAGRALLGCCIASALALPVQAQSPPPLSSPAPAPGQNAGLVPYTPRQHDAALAEWRAGRLDADAFIARLSHWIATSPDVQQQRRLRSDRIVAAAQSRTPSAALAFAREAPLAQLEAYALQPLISAARSAGDPALQGEVVQLLLASQPGSWDARVQEVLWLVDARRLPEAQQRLEWLASRPQAGLAPQQVTVRELRGALAEANQQPALALGHYQEVLVLQPDHRYAQRSTVLLTAQLGAPSAALETASAPPLAGRFNALELAGLQQASLGERLRWAVSQRNLLPDDARRFDALDAVLRDMQALAAQLPLTQAAAGGADPAAWQDVQRRLAADRVIALFERGRHADTVAQYAQLEARFGNPPWYARSAAAGAQAQLRRPDLAVPLYLAALREGGEAVPVPSDTHVGLVYAYLDTAQFAAADDLLAQMLARTPPLLSLSPERGRPNNDYGDLLGLRALVALYTDRPRQAQADFEQLVSLAPLNTPYRTGLARTLRLRQKPEAALQAFEELRTDDPRSVDAQAGHAETLFDVGQLGQATQRVNALAAIHPDSPSVRSAVRTRDTVMAPRLEVDAATGRDGGTLSNRDSTLQARLSSGWGDSPAGGQQRMFFQQWLGSADLGGDSTRRARSGLGLEWLNGPWRLEGQLHQSSTGPRRTGLALGADWRASDAWRLSARFDSNSTDLPWRAQQAGVAARDLQAQARYVVNESRAFSAQVQQRDYSDGNDRGAAGLAWQERWISGPRLQLQTTLAADAARNGRQDVPYFSPARESGAALTARAQWLTWKRDDRVFLQVLEAGAGRYRQAGFGSGPTSQLRYAHEWNWGAGWQLRYGLGTSTHPYDGVKERRKEAFVHFSMPFL